MRWASAPAVCAASVLLWIAGCGGSSATAPAPAPVQPAPAAPSVTSVAAACQPTTISSGGTSQCTATVQGAGSFIPSVTWAVSAGTVSSAGLVTAPAASGALTVTATSTANPAKSGTASITVQSAASPVPQVPASKHIVLVMEENQSYSTVVGNTNDWPNLNALLSTGALPTNYYADTHPSIGNYFMLTTGQILTNNDDSTQVWNVDNIARRMLAAGIPFRVYAEGIPQGYVGGNTGLYLVRHNPFALLSDTAGNPQIANRTIWPFSQFSADVSSGSLPAFSFVVPDVNDDAHNGTPAEADTWLQTNVVSPLSNTAAFQTGGDGLLIVDFDEAETLDLRHGGGRVSPVLWGPLVKRGYQQATSTVYQHESMLRTIMEALGLPNPPGSAASAPDMAEFFEQK